MTIMRRISILLIFVILLLIGLFFFACSETGTKLIWNSANKFFPEIILDGKLQGSLSDQITLTDLKLKQGEMTIAVDHIEFVWEPEKILSRELSIKLVKIDGLIIDDQSDPSPPSNEPLTLPDIKLPIAINLDQFQLTNSQYQAKETETIKLDLVSFALTTQDSTFHISDLQANIATGDILVNTRIDGQIEAVNHYPLNIDLAWQVTVPDLDQLNGSGNLTGDLEELTLQQTLTSPANLDLTATLNQLLTDLHWSANLKIHELNPRSIKPDLPELLFNSSFSARGDLKNIDLLGDYSVSSKEYGEWQGRLDVAQIMPADLTINTFEINDTGSEARVSLAGHIDLEETDAQLDLSGNWQELNFLDKEKNTLIQSHKGHFTVLGTPENYKLALNTDLRGQQIPQGNWKLAGQGSTKAFELESLHGDILDGTIDLTGNVSWGESSRWDLDLKGKDINPATFSHDKTAPTTDWPGKLALSATISGEQSEKQLMAAIKEARIEGTLRDYPLKVQTDLTILNEELDLKKLYVSSANSILKANGKAGKKLDLEWELNSPDLAELYPDAGGKFFAQGTLNGSQTAPQIKANLNGSNILGPDIKISQIDSKITLGLDTENARNQNFDIHLNTSQLSFGETLIEEIKVDGDGTLGKHSFKGELILNSALQQTLSLLANGGLEDKAWTGTIEKLDLNDKSIGKWQLQKAAKLIASAKKSELKQFCLFNDQMKMAAAKETLLCLNGQRQESGKWTGDAQLTSLPLSLFERPLSEHLYQDAKLDGAISANLKSSGNNDKNIKLALQVDATPGAFSMPDEVGSKISYDTTTFSFNFDQTGAKGELDFPIISPTKSPISASVSVPPFDPASADFTTLPITGKIQAKADNLSFLMQFTPELEELIGALDIDLDIRGTAAQPQLGGYAKLDASLTLPSAGIKLEDIKFEVKGDAGNSGNNNQNLLLTGRAKSGEGTLKIDGKVKVAPEENWPLTVSISGKRFELANLPEAWVLLSPDLTINNKDNKLRVEGEVTIPEATIEPTGIEDTVSLSDDVIIISDGQSNDKKEPAVNVYAKVKVILGDKIVIKGPGFSGAVKGNITAINKPGKPPRGNGELTVYDASYVAYGQDLEINKGRIIFADGPIDNPGLDIKATRVVKEITTGVHITGQASDPVLTLFSKPGMNQDNILSYLLTGRPLSEASESDGQLLANAATSMGLQGGNMLAQGIGQDLGLDDFSIGGDDQANAALQVGKYLTPKLYISYGVGIFEPVTSLKMRYDLSKRWSVEGESGTNSGMDFLYKYER